MFELMIFSSASSQAGGVGGGGWNGLFLRRPSVSRRPYTDVVQIVVTAGWFLSDFTSGLDEYAKIFFFEFWEFSFSLKWGLCSENLKTTHKIFKTLTKTLTLFTY